MASFDSRLRRPTASERGRGASLMLETASTGLFSRNRAAKDRARVAAGNASFAVQERRSAQRARLRGAGIRARSSVEAEAASQSIRVGQAATASNQLLSEFNVERERKEELRRRQGTQAAGRKTASFGASGIQSAGAAQEVSRQSTLMGNIQASQSNTRREGILNQTRQAISGARAAGAAAGIRAAGSVAAASQFGQLFQRQVSTDTGIDINRSRFF